MKKGELLFVYGSLRPGEKADLSRRTDASYITDDEVNGRMYTISWFPGVTGITDKFDPDSPRIVGDVFRIDDDNLVSILDLYEGHPDLFKRVKTQSMKGLDIWIYQYNQPVREDDSLVESGDWSKRALVPSLMEDC